ncbi:SMI1/KNR4 family protein [Flintibacter muris]|uniref:SMI1/KNR4 family protein n=1 Tax=Flintibacter muris TaxID=2941327 RepID=UPI002041E8CA|nr:SMI1/KNR4 family protein [Flintibacter muris]
MIARFLNYMRAKGCQVEMESPPPLPQWITGRYHNLPHLWLQFVGTVSELFSPDETVWFLCAEDYDTRLDHAWRWNEWEQLSLENAQGDREWTGQIKDFWDQHLPIVLSVRDGYAYYAISMADGSVVYGRGPEFEACETAAASFAEFLERIMDGTIQI